MEFVPYGCAVSAKDCVYTILCIQVLFASFGVLLSLCLHTAVVGRTSICLEIVWLWTGIDKERKQGQTDVNEIIGVGVHKHSEATGQSYLCFSHS